MTNNASNANLSLLTNVTTPIYGYGTFSEEPTFSTSSTPVSLSRDNVDIREIHPQLESGQKCFKDYVSLSPTTLVVKNLGSTARDNFGK